MDPSPPRDPPSSDDVPAVQPDDILAIRLGPGANCSSIGSALDLLFLSAVAGGALLAAVAAAFPVAARARPGPPAPPPGPVEEDASTAAQRDNATELDPTEETDARPT